MFRGLQGSRWGMLSGAAALILLLATVLAAATGPAGLAIALGVVSTLVGLAAIGFLIAWIVRTDQEPTPEPRPRRPRPPGGRSPRARR